MKLQLLPSTFEENASLSPRQHLTCFVVDDCVAFDAGSLAMATTALQKENIRDVVLSHAHLDHIAGLPLFVDDLFASLTEPIRVHASAEVIEVLQRDIFNWSVYPRFSELTNKNGNVLMFQTFEAGAEFIVRHLTVQAIGVNHKVPSSGFIVSDGKRTISLTGDTAEMDEFWEAVNGVKELSAILIECAFPDELSDLAEISHHLTPSGLERELKKIRDRSCPVLVVNIKPMYRDQTIRQIEKLGVQGLEILEVNRVYEF